MYCLEYKVTNSIEYKFAKDFCDNLQEQLSSSEQLKYQIHEDIRANLPG